MEPSRPSSHSCVRLDNVTAWRVIRSMRPAPPTSDGPASEDRGNDVAIRGAGAGIGVVSRPGRGAPLAERASVRSLSVCRATARALVVGLTLAPAVAHADRAYLGLGFHGPARVGGSLGARFAAVGEVNGRFVGGVRRGDLALEASFFGTDLHVAGSEQAPDGASTHSTLSFGAGLKRYLPLTPNVELFVRGGVDRTLLVPCPDRQQAEPSAQLGLERGHDLGATRLAGFGLDYGVGLEVGTRGPRWAVRAWFDLGGQHVFLDGADGARVAGNLVFAKFGVSLVRGY